MVNIAILGSGLFATNSYLPALSQPSNAHITLHTLWSRSPSSVSKLSQKAGELKHSPRTLHGDEGLTQIWSDETIDAVCLVLPITAQPDLILTALKHGKHVLSEKPVGKDVKAARELIEVYEREYKPKGLIWRVAENYEHDTLIRAAGEMLSNEETLGPILYWQLKTEGVIVDGSSYQATSWRTIPDYQGGFLLDGGVHATATLRTVLPPHARPSTIISHSSLHRAHLPPHDTILGLSMPAPNSTTAPHGSPTALKALRDESSIPGGVGKSSPAGTILLSFALPDTPPESRAPQGLTVTTLNAVLEISNVARKWTLKVVPAAGSGVEAREESQMANGVEVELGMFARAVGAVKGGKEVAEGEEGFGDPRGALWDVAAIEALLTSNGQAVELEKLIKGE